MKIQLPKNTRQLPQTGKNYLTRFYNLDAIISVGYRVNSIRATQFRHLPLLETTVQERQPAYSKYTQAK